VTTTSQAFRLATPHDVPAITALVNKAFLVERFLFDGDRTSVAEIKALLKLGSFLLAERDGGLAAGVYVEIRGNRGYIGMLSVDPDLQGSGLGRSVMAQAEDHCRKAGCFDVDLSLIDRRAELKPFYRKLGYVEVGTAPYPEPDKAREPCSFILMSKRLT
jgi:GNAT superfamily N-acetyltransferase